jgi:uncharacterized protein
MAFAVRARQTHSMLTRDGIRLDADVYYPAGTGLFPVLLMRQPYGRAIASTIVYAHPTWYAAHGYIVVIQDVRGRGTSAGEFRLFAHEVADGEDTLQWAAALPGSDGQVGMYGFSYQGMTQLYAAQSRHRALKAIAPAMTGYHPYTDWAYENGALCLQLGLAWALQLAAETARLKGDAATYQQLCAAARHLPLQDQVPARPAVLANIDSFFHDWVAHPASDAYWQKLTPQLAEVNLPMLHIGGWYDPYLRGDLRLYREMSARPQISAQQAIHPQARHPLWVGPWGHIPWGRKVGAVDFGPAAMSPIDRLQIRWFDHILKGKTWLGEDATEKPVQLFEMGRNQWRGFKTWPTGPVKIYCLQSDGLAHIREDSGRLSESLLTADETGEPSYDRLVHDPWNPAPALGGHSALPAGVFERMAIDSRGDVLTYTSAPMTTELRVAGICELLCEVLCELLCEVPSFDLCAVLSRVQNGSVYNLTQGYCRIDRPVSNEPVTLALHPTCFSLAAGEALRLSLSAACFPAYPVNPGTGALPQTASLMEAQIVTLAIATGQSSQSQLRLPTANAEASAED